MNKIDNKLDSFFGPSGTFAGYVLMIAGVVTMLEGYGIVFLILGAFMSFTFLGTEVDISSDQYRYYVKLFGVFKRGTWQSLKFIQALRVVRGKVSYTTYSRSNRTLNLSKKDYRVILEGYEGTIRVPVIKYKTFEEASTKASELRDVLDIPFME